MNLLGAAIFGDSMAPIDMMIRPLPTGTFATSLLFPPTIGFAEPPTYFAYSMPRLEAQLKNRWAARLIASLFLRAPHMFLPLILDGNFMRWQMSQLCLFI